MARRIRTPRRSDPLEAQQKLKAYRVYRKKDNVPMLEFVARFDTLWKAVHEFEVTELDGIEKLIELLPNSWKEWATTTSKRYTWYQDESDDMKGDLKGFRKAIYCALVDSEDDLPPQPADEEFEDKQMIVHEAEAENRNEGELGMVPGYEEDYEEDPEEEPEEDLGGNPIEDSDEDPEEGPMEEDD